MALKPKKYRGYWPSSTTHPVSKNFRGYGSDGSEGSGGNKTDYTLYIGFEPNDRVLAFKAFIESIKLNISKDGSWHIKKDNSIPIYTPLNGKVGYTITLNMPAHSVNESRNNMAKIVELQRMIVPARDLDPTATPLNAESRTTMRTRRNIFRVLFRNLINNGNANADAASRMDSFTELAAIGLPCYIESVKYEPDLEMGFFEDQFINYKLPRNIKLNLTLNVDTEFGTEFGMRPIRSFNSNGTYAVDDYGFFPFLVKPHHDKGEIETEDRNFANSLSFMKQSNMNKITNDRAADGTIIYISIPIHIGREKSGSLVDGSSLDYSVFRRGRYVVFKPFIEEFSREVSTEIGLHEYKDASVFTKTRDWTFKPVKINFKFNIINYNVREAIQNCGKIQYLIKMFYKLNKTRNDNLTDQTRNFLRVYIPDMIEILDGDRLFLRDSVTQQQGYYFKAAALIPEKLDINIDSEMGFFESGGYLYPKVMSVSMELTDALQSNIPQLQIYGHDKYKFEDRTPAEDAFINVFGLCDGSDECWTGGSLYYPFNKKYTKIGD